MSPQKVQINSIKARIKATNAGIEDFRVQRMLENKKTNEEKQREGGKRGRQKIGRGIRKIDKYKGIYKIETDRQKDRQRQRDRQTERERERDR